METMEIPVTVFLATKAKAAENKKNSKKNYFTADKRYGIVNKLLCRYSGIGNSNHFLVTGGRKENIGGFYYDQ